MKGIIFTEFIEMVEEKFGFVTAEKIISNSTLSSGGVYTAVGTYNFNEMLQLVTNLSKETSIAVPDLLIAFGKHLFSGFFKVYPHYFTDKVDAFDFLINIERYIHAEVLKLYPDAELPKIDTVLSEDQKELTLVYSSNRKLGDLAVGLIEGCADLFNQKFYIQKTLLKDDGSFVKFVITKTD